MTFAFSAEIERSPDAVSVTAAGDIDVASAPEFEDALRRAEHAAGRVALIVDLSGATFIDCSAIHALVQARRRQRACGRGFAVVLNDARLTRLLQLLGLERVLGRYDSRAEAIAGAAGRRGE